jgi:hypothetical protein
LPSQPCRALQCCVLMLCILLPANASHLLTMASAASGRAACQGGRGATPEAGVSASARGDAALAAAGEEESVEPDTVDVADDVLALLGTVSRDASHCGALAEAPRLRLLMAAFKSGMGEFRRGHHRVATGVAQVRTAASVGGVLGPAMARSNRVGSGLPVRRDVRQILPVASTTPMGLPPRVLPGTSWRHGVLSCSHACAQVLFELSQRPALLPALAGNEVVGPMEALVERGVDYAACDSAKAAQVLHGAWASASVLQEVRCERHFLHKRRVYALPAAGALRMQGPL